MFILLCISCIMIFIALLPYLYFPMVLVNNSYFTVSCIIPISPYHTSTYHYFNVSLLQLMMYYNCNASHSVVIRTICTTSDNACQHQLTEILDQITTISFSHNIGYCKLNTTLFHHHKLFTIPNSNVEKRALNRDNWNLVSADERMLCRHGTETLTENRKRMPCIFYF
jgi:hypothetical protein